MYFKKLELVGFKSFMGKTTLHFEPGITAVVGPNGCGKSNILDSIRWVLGEQSAKALRGSAMEDVIFNGTDSQPPLGMAEVSLTFDNENNFFALDHDEVVITRRIFRSGESEYLMNKAYVRLKDIMDLLMGTGIGAESYSIIAQGKIDLILSSRPEDRRIVFDEAAGITKYKSQKKEALRKLEETEQNLLRVNDIIMEVKRQIGSLERQANKARRYKEVFTELKSKELNLAAIEKNKLSRERYEITLELNTLAEEEEKIQNCIQEEEAKISQRNHEIRIWQDNIANIKNQVLNLENLVLRNSEHIGFNTERITELDQHKKYLEEQMQQAKSRLIQDEEKLKKLKEEQSEIKKNIEEKSLLLKEKENQFNRLVTAIKASLENINKAKRKILDLVTQSTQVKNEITDVIAKYQTHQARAKRLEIEKAKVKEEKAMMQETLNNLSSELKKIEECKRDFELKLAHLKNELEQENSSLKELNRDAQDLERKKLSLQSHREFLENLKTRYDDIDTSLNAVVYLDKPLPEGIKGLIMKVKNYLTLNPEDKPGLASVHLKLSGEAKPIDIDTQQVEEKINQIEKNIESLNQAKTAKESYLQQLNQRIQDWQQKQQAEQISSANKKTVYETTAQQLNKIKEEEEVIVIELAEVEEELLKSQNKLNELQSQLSGLDKEYKDSESLILNEQEKINSDSHLKEEALVTITQTKTEIDSLARRLDSEASALKAQEANYQQDQAGLENLKTQFKETGEKQESLKAEIKDLENKISQDQKEIKGQNSSLKEAEEKYREISGGLTDIVKKIEEKKKALDSLKEKIHGQEMQNKDLDFRYMSIKERILQSYKIDLDSTVEMNFPDGIEENTLTQEIKTLKEKLDSYGAVNLVAIEEYDELKKRYDFLIQQQSDLVQAQGSLKEAIQKINRTTRKMFLETFEQVCKEFKNYFRLLFNGGDAQIFLIDEQDPLESGIEIICRPPGKKLQNVLLLSGGEKSLSAIALIFAILKIKPTPFCILDEIDAALDEANVDRYARLLQEFTSHSQFIVITHNKRTIANADVMYGITMEESGVSKIVSVKFASDRAPEEDREPVAA